MAGLLALCLATTPLFAVELPPYGIPVGFGDAWSVATASTGVAIDSGLVGGYRNPAGFLTDHNEIQGEGSAWGAIAIRNRIAPSPIRYGAGSIGYLNSYSTGSLFVVYETRSQLEEGAHYQDVEVVDRANVTQFGLGYSLRASERYALGLYAGSVRGSTNHGVLQNSTDLDTVYTPRLWVARLGIRKRTGSWRWGATIEAPPFGSLIAERPVNVARKRANETYSYRGTVVCRAGVGKVKSDGSGYEGDVSWGDGGMIRLGDDPIKKDHSLLSAGVTAHWRWSDNLLMAGGVRYQIKDLEDQSMLLYGLGGEYTLTPQVNLYGGAGLLFPVQVDPANTILDDIRPWLLRGGILFHEKE